MVWVRLKKKKNYSAGLCVLSTFNVKQIQVKFPKQYKIEVFNLKILYTRAYIYTQNVQYVQEEIVYQLLFYNRVKYTCIKVHHDKYKQHQYENVLYGQILHH